MGNGSFGVVARLFDRRLVFASFEFMLILSAILAVNFAQSGKMFWGSHLDPFLIPVVLISVQYGLGMGLTAAVASALLVLTGDLPPLSFDRDLYSYWTEIAARPALWLGAALVLGSLSSRHIRRSVRLSETLAEADRQKNCITTAYGEARQVNDELLLRLNSNQATLPAVSLVLQRLFRKTQGEILEALDELVALTLDARSFSVFMVADGALQLARQKGWEPEAMLPHCYDAHSLLYDAVVGERRLLCIANPLDEVFLARDGVLAGPIFDADAGRVIGMLKVETLDFVRFHAEAIEHFRIVAEWLGLALAQTVRGREEAYPRLVHAPPLAGSRQVASNGTRATSAALSARACAIEYALSVAAIRVSWQRGLQVDIAAVGEALRRTVVALLRAPEHILDTEDLHSAFFFIVLPKASAANTRAFAETLELALQQCLPAATHRPSIEILGSSTYETDEPAYLPEHFSGLRALA
jgi:hypothetical protein